MTGADEGHATLTMPSLGETMEHGLVAEWLVAEGEAFKRGDALLEFETDKTAVEFPALGNGLLLRQLVKPGESVAVGDPIATIDIGEGPDWTCEQSDDRHTTDAGPTSGGVAKQPVDENSKAIPGESVAEQLPIDSGDCSDGSDHVSGRTDNGDAIRATPVARKLARQHGIALNAVVGTGRRQRIEAHDVQAHLQSQSSAIDFVKGSTDAASMEQASGTALHYLDGIAYHLAGRPTGVPVVMLHGFAADSTAWSLLARTLVKANCRVLTIDLPGHGNTVVNAHDVDSLQQGMQNVLAANTTDRAWHVVAHSLGTMPALALVQSPADFRVESLSLISPVGLGLSIDREFIAGMAKPSSIAELSHLMRRLGSRPSTLSTAAADELFSRLGQGRLVQLAESILGAHGQTLDSHATIDTLSRQLPVRIIIGHADRIIRWQDALQVSPLVGVHHFPTAGHMPHWDFPREVAQIILSAQ